MSTSYNICCLPDSVLTLSGYDFDQLIRNILGDPEADLLKKMSIQTTASFLSIEDPLEIFNHEIDDEDVEKLKHKLCFKLKNKSFIIKPGVISGFRTLREALIKKADKHIAQSKSQRKQRQNLSSANPPVVLLEDVNNQSKAQTSTNDLSLDKHKEHVKKLITKWCIENKEQFNLEEFCLEDNVDYTINLEFDENLDVKGSIKCKCTKLISLARNGTKLQVSNFYKHLLCTSCEHMKSLKRNVKKSKPTHEKEQLHLPNPLTPERLVHSSIQSADNNQPIVMNETIRAGKRRTISQSQQSRPTKRSRF